jgi:antitoxin VapB
MDRKRGRWYSSFMSLNIKDPETDRLARALATETGESITMAAKRAIQERLIRVRAQRNASDGVDLAGIIARGRARPLLDTRAADDVLGYDPIGLPT